MKKILFSLVILSSLVACESKTEKTATAVPTDATGYILASSENINMVKKALDAGLISDSAVIMSIYADTAAVYDNMNKQSIVENLKMGAIFKAKGITVKLEKINDIFETVGLKPDDFGISNYVNVYFNASFTKGTQKIVTRINAVFAIKDGKVVTEWDTYDSAPIAELFK